MKYSINAMVPHTETKMIYISDTIKQITYEKNNHIMNNTSKV